MMKLLQRLQTEVISHPHIFKTVINVPGMSRLLCSDNKTSKTPEVDKGNQKDPEELEEPTNCCQSGCANCVYIEYATKLMENFELGGDEAKKVILEKIRDPSMKAFLEMELRMKLKPK